MNEADDLSRMLIAAGDERLPANELLPVVYAQLRRTARILLSRVPPGNTFQPTALVHEAYLRLVQNGDPGWKGSAHFFAAAARTMRLVLVDQARRKGRKKHGGGLERLGIDEVDIPIKMPNEDVEALHEALEELERLDDRAARVVELRYFAGLSAEDTAKALGVSLSTVERDWRVARPYLHSRIVT